MKHVHCMQALLLRDVTAELLSNYNTVRSQRNEHVHKLLFLDRQRNTAGLETNFSAF